MFIIPRYGEMVDTVARTANAFYVLFSRYPHLGAIGFVWTPLPSLLALPLVALKNVWPGLVQDAVALNMVSALFGGLAVFFLLRMLRRLNVPGPVRWALAALLTLNPFVIFYATNGMTDMMMAATLLGAVDGLWAYLEDGYAEHHLAVSGLWMAIGFLMRYELLPWALVVAGALAVGLARLPQHERPAFGCWHWMGGALLVWLTPLGYAVALWLFFNWTIMHNPFYFQHGAYGNDAAVGTGAYLWGPLEAARGHIVATLAVVGRQTAIFPPVVVGLVGLLAYGLWGCHERHTRALVVMAGTLGVPLLHVMLVYIGSGDPLWLRFFLTFIPFGIVSLAYTARLASTWKTPPVGARALRGLIWTACIVGVAAGDGVSGYEFFVPAAAPTHFEPLSPISVMTGAAASRFLDAYLNAHPRFTVLADSWQAFPVLISLQHPERVVTTSDPDFKQTLDDPIGRVNAFLVPVPKGASKLDAVDRLYPDLWAHGAPWAHLIADFPGGVHFRLYAIGAPGQVRPATTQTRRAPRCTPDHPRRCGGLHGLAPDPTATFTPQPTSTPTPRPTAIPRPTVTPSPRPTRTPTPRPTATPTTRPTRTPTALSVPTATLAPRHVTTPPIATSTAVPTPRPTGTPTPVSITIGSTTAAPTPRPTSTPIPLFVTIGSTASGSTDVLKPEVVMVSRQGVGATSAVHVRVRGDRAARLYGSGR
jgi:hypothetical protein